jgi:hypothetical protein
MSMPWVRRRLGQTRLHVWMPYQGSSNRQWILQELGTRTRPIWNGSKTPGRWEIARPHLHLVVTSLVQRFGQVDVYLEFSNRTRCDVRCQQAEGDDCECSCLGENHGGAAYWRNWTLVGQTTLLSERECQVRHYLVQQ